ncbi:MAG TPA: AraC family transcriptional regulator [Pyrinomonadaceae bacterium]|jgi:AraC family transcriptional regulator|nr:AraC family transcriptional regulator [Pyrinomonadaceae bacterium]
MIEAEKTAAVPVTFKRKAAWEGIKLEHYLLPVGELPKHQHSEHVVMISLTEGARGEIRTASGARISGTQHRGNVCVLPSGLAHTARLETASEHLAMHLDPSLVRRAASESLMSGNFEVMEKCISSDGVVSSIGWALLGELESEGLSGRLYAESLANVLAVHLLRHYTTGGSEPQRAIGGLSGLKLKHVMDFVAENYSNDVRLVELANVAGMSEFHFSREFKRTTGTTPHQYLIKFRVEQAKALLAKAELPLTEVGLRSGFSHQSHFTRLFRRLTGTTPQSYRLMLQT